MATPPASLKDAQQVLRYAFDDTNGRLRVDAVITPDGHDLEIHYADDSIAIGDPTTQTLLHVNPDGSLNVNLNSSPTAPGTVKSKFNELLSVASGVTVTIVSYQVPVGMTAILQRISSSGQNIAQYDVYLNNVKFDTKRTYFGSAINVDFDYTSGSSDGLVLQAGDTLAVQVYNYRPSSANFEARIQVLEQS